MNFLGRRCDGTRFFDWATIYGVDAEYDTPYMTRLNIGRLSLHVFHRGDADPDCHDHPWAFWTFPLIGYVEEVVDPQVAEFTRDGVRFQASGGTRYLNVVKPFRLHYRPATHAHRVLGRHAGGEAWRLGKIVTIVWKAKRSRAWGFLKTSDDRWCWVPWKDYVFGGENRTPCE